MFTHTHEKLHARTIIRAYAEKYIHVYMSKAARVKMNIPRPAPEPLQNQHFAAFQTIYPLCELGLQGNALILTDRIHFLSVHGWGRPIVYLCVRVGVGRQMFPAQGSRKEVKQRLVSCLHLNPNCFLFLPPSLSLSPSPTSPPPRPAVKPLSHRSSRSCIWPRGVPTTG